MEILHAIILGIIEGLTEFLPISSTGHLIVAEHLLGFKDKAELFTVVIQVGAIAAVIWHYRTDINHKIRGLIRRDSGITRFWLNLIIAVAPAGLFGLIFDKTLQKYSEPRTVAVSLIIGGIILWAVETFHHTRAAKFKAGETPQPSLEDITPKQALGIGVAQIASLVPGVSRSGSTIVGGLLAGLDRVTATAFSFYLSIPVIILASGYKLVKEGDKVSQLPGGVPALAVGIITSFITGLLAVNWLLRYVSHHDFKWFAYYRIVFGLVILALLAVNVL